MASRVEMGAGHERMGSSTRERYFFSRVRMSSRSPCDFSHLQRRLELRRTAIPSDGGASVPAPPLVPSRRAHYGGRWMMGMDRSRADCPARAVDRSRELGKLRGLVRRSTQACLRRRRLLRRVMRWCHARRSAAEPHRSAAQPNKGGA
jgi:hypothetical protein